jgi:hypothetical protein
MLIFFGASRYGKRGPNEFLITSRTTLFDFGITAGLTLLIVPTIIALIKSISSWISKTSAAQITIKDQSGKIIAENIDPTDVNKIIEAIQDNQRSR